MSVTPTCFKFVVRGKYDDTLRYLEKEKAARPDVRFAFDTRKNSIDQNCQTPEHFFNEVLQLNAATSTLKRKRSLFQEHNRYSKDSGFSSDSLDHVGLDNRAIPKIDTSDLVLDQNILELIDLGRFSHLAPPADHCADPLARIVEPSYENSSNGSYEYPDEMDEELDEEEFWDQFAIDIERISPVVQAEYHTYHRVKNKHLQEVIKTTVKSRMSDEDVLGDLFEDLDMFCEGIAEKISEKIRSDEKLRSLPGSPTSFRSGRRQSSLTGAGSPKFPRSSRRSSAMSSPRQLNRKISTASLPGVYSGMYDPRQEGMRPALPRRTSEFYGRGGGYGHQVSNRKFSQMSTDESVGTQSTEDLPTTKSVEIQCSPSTKRKKKKRVFRSNSAGDILETMGSGDKRERKGSIGSLLDGIKRRVSVKPKEAEDVPDPEPEQPEITYTEETTKHLQTPQYIHKQHARVMAEIKDAMEMARIDIPAMFIYDVDLTKEVWVSQPGDNRIYQLEKCCAVCKEGFQKSTFIVCSGGLFWHNQCFVCVQCFRPFKDDPSQESVFYEHEDRPYCHNCYTVNFAPMCFTCGGWVIGRVIEALDVKWHPECFGCYMCGAELCENGFFKHNGRPICIDCHDLLKKRKMHICNKCDTPIEEYVLWHLKEPYHPYHFSCQICFKPLDSKIKEKDNTYYCQLCYDTEIQDVCAACKKAIDGRAIKAAEKAWCPEHFVCYACERPLTGEKFMLHEKVPYCQFHFTKLFGVRCFYCDNRSSMQVIKVLNKNYCENHFFCTGCDTLLEEQKSKVIEMDQKPYCRHCYDKFPSDMRRKLLESANAAAKNKKATMKKDKDKKGTMKKKKEEKKKDKDILNATQAAS